MKDLDILKTAELLLQKRNEPLVELEGKNFFCPLYKNAGKVPKPWPDFEHPVLRPSLRCVGYLFEVVGIPEKILAQGFFCADVVIHKFRFCHG